MNVTTPRRKRKNNFIDNKEFYAAMKKYIADIHEAKEKGEPQPRIPRYIGKCFLDIAEHLSTRPNFSNYMYRQDMVMDAVENCVIYCNRFDPNKSSNPFSYFTQVCWYAFIRRIGKEKKQIEICDKLISKSGYEEFFVGDSMGEASNYNSIKDAVDQKRKGGN